MMRNLWGRLLVWFGVRKPYWGETNAALREWEADILRADILREFGKP